MKFRSKRPFKHNKAVFFLCVIKSMRVQKQKTRMVALRKFPKFASLSPPTSVTSISQDAKPMRSSEKCVKNGINRMTAYAAFTVSKRSANIQHNILHIYIYIERKKCCILSDVQFSQEIKKTCGINEVET